MEIGSRPTMPHSYAVTARSRGHIQSDPVPATRQEPIPSAAANPSLTAEQERYQYGPRVTREYVSPQGRRAVNAYTEILENDQRTHVARLLGIDVYA